MANADSPKEPHNPLGDSLVFVRHGEPDLPSPARLFLGHAGPGLSLQGRAQAEKAALWAKPFPWQGCFCSPLDRATETARFIGQTLGIEPIVKKELAEIDLGSWDGREKSEISREHPDAWKQREKNLYHFSPVENPCRTEARVVLLLSLLLKGGRWLIVSHAGVFRVLLHGLFKVPFPETFRLDPWYGGIRLVERQGKALLVKDPEGLQIVRGELP